MCIHDSYDIDKLFVKRGEGNWLGAIHNMVNGDLFPDIENGCTEQCKEKMIKYTQAVYKNYMNSICWYYNDVKILTDFNHDTDYGDSSFSSYISSTLGGFKEENTRYFNYTPQLEGDSSKFPDYPNVSEEIKKN